MQRTSVQSSNLSSVGYDSALQILEIEFHTSGVYQYHGVPESVYDALMSAGSKGTYFAQYIKKGGYQYQKVG